jgi:hypothetical protein
MVIAVSEAPASAVRLELKYTNGSLPASRRTSQRNLAGRLKREAESGERVAIYRVSATT